MGQRTGLRKEIKDGFNSPLKRNLVEMERTGNWKKDKRKKIGLKGKDEKKENQDGIEAEKGLC